MLTSHTCVSRHGLYRCQSKPPKWPSSVVRAGWKSLEALLAACTDSVGIQKELWEAGASGLFPRQLILSKVNVCKKCSFSLVAPDTADFLTRISFHWPGLERVLLNTGQQSSPVLCVQAFEELLAAHFIPPRGRTRIRQLPTLYACACAAVRVLQKTP